MFFKKRIDKYHREVLKKLDGREINYVTRHIGDTADIEIVGKKGRIIALDGYIKIYCGTTDVFKCRVDKAEYYFLPSLSTVMIKGINEITGKFDQITVNYSRFHNM
jgi:hypothetical protein